MTSAVCRCASAGYTSGGDDRSECPFRPGQLDTAALRVETDVLLKMAPPWFVRLPLHVLAFLAGGWRRDKKTLAVRIRLALEKSGAIFVKFGQTLSTRRDLLPRDIADELAKLQDHVPPFPGAEAKTIIAQALDEPARKGFFWRLTTSHSLPLRLRKCMRQYWKWIEKTIRSSSKCYAPRIKRQIDRDIALLYLLAKLFGWIKPAESRRLRLLEVIEEYRKTIMGELDLMREAANASQLRRNFTGSSLLYVPKVYWRYCRREVMVVERIDGVSISDMPRLEREQVDLKELSERGVEIFFTQVFEHNFFSCRHASRQCFYRHERSAQAKVSRCRFWHYGNVVDGGSALSGREFSGFFFTTTIAGLPSCISSRDGCLPTPEWTNSNRLFVQYASRFSNAH